MESKLSLLRSIEAFLWMLRPFLFILFFIPITHSSSSPALSSTNFFSLIPDHVVAYQLVFNDVDIGYLRFEFKSLGKNHFVYKINTNVKFFLLSDTREVNSYFSIKNGQVFAQKFEQTRSGTGKDFVEKVDFLPASKKVVFVKNNKKKTLLVNEPIYDVINSQVQMRLDFLNKKNKSLSYLYFYDEKQKKVEFELISHEKINLLSKDFDVVKLSIKRKSKKRQSFIWLDKTLAYVPLKIVDTRGKNFTLEANMTYFYTSIAKQPFQIGQDIIITPMKEIKKVTKKKKHHKK